MDTDPLVIRCSALPEAFKCPGSVRLGALQVEADFGDASPLGQATHELLRPVVHGDAHTLGDLDLERVCSLFGVSVDDVIPLIAAGLKIWPEIRHGFPDPQTEIKQEYTGPGYSLVGHVDAVSVLRQEDRPANVISGLDWKTGRVDRDHGDQARGYMATAIMADEFADCATWTIVWLREREVERYNMTRPEARDWLKNRVERVIVKWRGVYTAGRHCTYCKRSHDCAAVVAKGRRDLAILGKLGDDSMTDQVTALEPAQAFDLIDRAAFIRSVLDSFDEAIRLRLEQQGPIETADRRLYLKEQNERRLSTLEAWEVLQRNLTDIELASVVKVSLTRAEKAIATKAGRGKGAAAVRQFNEDLKAANALSTDVVKRRKDERK